jgi:hypothetical protein
MPVQTLLELTEYSNGNKILQKEDLKDHSRSLAPLSIKEKESCDL